MSRIIDAEKLKAHYSWWGDTEERRDFDAIVDAQPTVDIYETDEVQEMASECVDADALIAWLNDVIAGMETRDRLYSDDAYVRAIATAKVDALLAVKCHIKEVTQND